MSYIINQLRDKMTQSSSNYPYPFTLLEEDGEFFTALGLSKGNAFVSKYFHILSIDRNNNLAELELLKPLYAGTTLFRTEARMVVDLSHFFGIQFLPIPIFDGQVRTKVLKEQDSLSFHLTNNHFPQNLWENNQNAGTSISTIRISFLGDDSKLHLQLSTLKEIIPLTIPKGQNRAVTVADLQSINIIPPFDKVKGEIELQVNHCQKIKYTY